MKKYLVVLLSVPIFAGIGHLTLPQALQIVKKDNLELKIARFNEQIKAYEAKAARGHNYGKAEASLMAMRSNDAGNVFGFKLQSREATFGDFGFKDFLNPLGGAIYGASQGNPPPDMSGLLQAQPDDLNYPKARNHYLTKFSYMLPIYTGGKLTEYGRISKAMVRMAQYDTQKLLNEKLFQTRKTFYDITLVENYIRNLSKIISNIRRLKAVVKAMQKEGYAQPVDVMEVEARLAEAQSMYNQAKLNRDLAYQFLSFLLNKEVDSICHVNEMAPMPKVSKKELESNNIDIQKAILGLQISKMAINVQRAEFLPTLGGFAEYGSADNTIWNEFRQKDFYTVGLQLKWNIFNGGIDKANYEKAKVNYMMVHDQVELAKKGIALKVDKLKTEIGSIEADIRSYKQQLRYAHKVYENYKARYREGLVSISDLLVKQSKELEMLLKLLAAKNQRNTKIFQLNSILNQGV
jgi:outer membrane protein TolC